MADIEIRGGDVKNENCGDLTTLNGYNILLVLGEAAECPEHVLSRGEGLHIWRLKL